jgi:hypothetical protein
MPFNHVLRANDWSFSPPVFATPTIGIVAPAAARQGLLQRYAPLLLAALAYAASTAGQTAVKEIVVKAINWLWDYLTGK